MDDGRAFTFYLVFRKPTKLFARRRVDFNDVAGVHFCGLWYAPISVEQEHIQVTNSLNDIKEAAKMSVVAIPMWYIIGKGKADSEKYCVISNWWKVRSITGQYVLPTLDRSYYTGNDGCANNNII